MGHRTVMLSAAKHLDAQRERPFAAAQGDKKGPSRQTLRCLFASLRASVAQGDSGGADFIIRIIY